MDEQDLWKLYTDELRQYKPLSAEEERGLFILNTPEAKEKLFLHSTGLVIHIAKNYHDCGVLFLDIVSEWMMWLRQAIDLYDVSMKTRLATYAMYWIKVYITRFIVKSRTVVSLPTTITAEANNIWKQLDKEWITVDNVGESLKRKISTRKVIDIINSMWKTVSLDTPSNTDTNSDAKWTVKDLLQAPKSEQPDELIEETFRIANIFKILKQLFPSREVDMLKSYYWVVGNPIRTQKEMADQYGYSSALVNLHLKVMKKRLNKCRALFLWTPDENTDRSNKGSGCSSHSIRIVKLCR